MVTRTSADLQGFIKLNAGGKINTNKIKFEINVSEIIKT